MDWYLWLFLGFIAITLAILVYIIDRKKAWWVLEEWLGKKPEIKDEKGSHPISKDFPVRFIDGNMNCINHWGVKEQSDTRFALLDKDGIPFSEVDFNKPFLWKNYKSFMKAGSGNELVFQIIDDSYVENLHSRIEALKMSNIQKDDEVMERALSHAQVIHRDAEIENKRVLKLWKGRRFMNNNTFFDKRRGSQPPMEGGEEGGFPDNLGD